MTNRVFFASSNAPKSISVLLANALDLVDQAQQGFEFDLTRTSVADVVDKARCIG